MTKEEAYEAIKAHRLAVVSTSSAAKRPQAALVGIAVSEELELVFDTVTSSRKYRNLQQNPHVAVVIGWDNETTVQYEGIATVLDDTDTYYKELYYAVFPDGRQRAANMLGLVHIKVSPRWIRYSDFNDPQAIEEVILTF